jgi:hypothetical protein
LTPGAAVWLVRTLVRKTKNGRNGSKELYLEANFVPVLSSEFELMVRLIEEWNFSLLNSNFFGWNA